MKPTLSLKFLSVSCALFVSMIFSMQAKSQTWTFRNGFGQAGAANSIADVGKAVAVDASGNVYIAGVFNDDLAANTISFGGAALVSAGDEDGFVAKFNASGVHQWSIRLGSVSLDNLTGIATNGTSVYVTGNAQAMTVGTSPTSYPAPYGGFDGFVVSVSAATGATNWVTRFGGAGTDLGQALTLDPAGNIYLSGNFRTRTGNPTATFGAFTRTVQGNYATYSVDLFVARLNSSGAFDWVSTGGSAGGSDNTVSSSIAYVPTTTQVVVTGSTRSLTSIPGAITSTYSTTSPVSSITITNSDAATNEEFILLELTASNGAFTNGFGIGAGEGNELGLGITYDPSTTDVFFAGSFSSPSITVPGVGPLTASGADNIFYGRYNVTTNAFIWAREVNNSNPATAADVARSITANGAGAIFIAGNFRNTITFPNGITATGSGAQSDIFVARVAAATGVTEYVKVGTGTAATGDDIAYGVAAAADGNVWITGVYMTALTLSPLAPLNSAGNEEDILLAKFADITTITLQPTAVVACDGVSASFTSTAGPVASTYQWQEDDNAAFSSPTNLTNAGVYSGVTTSTLNISNITGLNGRYYRVLANNGSGNVASDGALLTVTAPALSANGSVTQAVNTANNFYYGPACALIDRVVPNGASPIAGNITSRVWIEGAVPTEASRPFVQRHYEIMPAANASTATGTVTLYFTQAEFNAFNSAPGSTLNLPTGTADATGKANLRVVRYNGASNNGTGLPASYTAGATVIDPVDSDIVWNAAFSRWEVSFAVTGFGGFIVQTELEVLPVNLIAFNAQLSGGDVALNWTTSSETQNEYFEVERSIDGRNFTAVGRLAGTNGNAAVSYNLVDAGAANQPARRISYRLKIVSTAGTVEYSHVVIVSLEKTKVFVNSVQPNPFRDVLNISINASRNGRMNISIADVSGKIVQRESMNVYMGSSTQIVKSSASLASGIYTLIVNFDGETTTHKVVKQ